MKSVARALLLTLALMTMGSIDAQQVRPTHVTIVFDTTKSFWNNLHIAYAITERLLKELYFALPGHPDDKVTFIALNATPTIVTELRGLDLRRRASRKFIEAFGRPDQRLGTDVVGALYLADLAFSRNPDSIKFLFIFSDMQVDPARTSDGRPLHFRQVTEFDWECFSKVSIWIFFCPPQMEILLKDKIGLLRHAHFFSPPPTTNGILEKTNLEAFMNMVLSQFQEELAKQLSASGNGSQGGGLGLLVLVVCVLVIMSLLLGLFAYLAHRGGEIEL